MPAGERNLFGLSQYDYQTTFFYGQPAVLDQATGYAIVIGFGAFFAIFTSLLVYLDYRYGGTKYNSEDFNTAGRTIKTGLVAVDIVSHWTWSSTLLQSSDQAYIYGVSGPFWYAAGATIQILLFGVLAVQIKRRAPTAHTVLEIVKVRWGTAAHLSLFYFCLITNIIVSAQLILGGSAVISAVTGMNIYAACMLVPVGIILYTAVGGLKATFTSSYIHTVIVYVVLALFCFKVYATSEDLGSPSVVYQRLQQVAALNPIDGNRGGSFVTMWSIHGLLFGLIQVFGGFGTVFVDQAYWQSAIAAKPSASYKGYLLGGLMWFSIPLALATSLGLAVRAFDLPLSADEGNAGLVPPAAAFVLMGKGGAILVVIILFMAITSSGSAEMIAVSSLISYDIYKEYINPKARGKTMLLVSRFAVVGFGLFQGALAIIFNEVGVTLNYIFLVGSTLILSAVPPVSFAICWGKCSRAAALTGAFVGQGCGIAGWLVAAHHKYGTLNVTTTSEIGPTLAGAMVAMLTSLFLCIVISLWRPQNFDWTKMEEIKLLDDTDKQVHEAAEDSEEGMNLALHRIWWWGGGLTLILVVAWPLLALPAGVFSEGYFTFWVALSIAWGLIAMVACTVMPLAESRDLLWNVISSIVFCGAFTGKRQSGKAPADDISNSKATFDDDTAHGMTPSSPARNMSCQPDEAECNHQENARSSLA